MAFKNKHPEVILALLKNDEVYQSIEPFDVLMLASKEGYLDIVRYLITDKKIDLTDADEAIEEAIENNHLEIVQILFNDPRINKSDLNLPYFLVLATQNNRTDIVHFLIENEGANPEAENSEAIRWAYKVKNRDIIQLFVAVTEKNRQAITSTTNTPEAGEDVNKLASRIKKEKRSSSFMSKIKQALT
jgi:ankyrin repeat protein